MMYESMKMKVEAAVERGKVKEEYISSEEERQLLSQYRTQDFTRQNHPSLIQVLLNSKTDVDNRGGAMPNLIYVSREKSKSAPHHFKAGALNALLRVSASMTNSPIILTLDCDMYSNDPFTAQRVLCYLPNRSTRPNCGYVQFPQRYHGLNKADIYASEHKRLFLSNPIGMDGLNGPSYVGTGCFFRRRVFFGAPSSYIKPETPELAPDHIVDKPINGREVLSLAHHVASCSYENRTNWGSKMGFRYGSLVEDYYTGYRLQCEGWQSIFCDPSRPAFLGDVPITLDDVLSQNKRWSVGLLEVGFSKYSPSTFGIRAMGLLMGQSYAHYAFWPIWSFPVTVYAVLPSLALLQGIPIFPKMGFRYGSLVEDYYTGYRLQCEGWQSIFCDPNRPAFLGDVPISLNDALNQNKRWSVGLLEVGFSKYSPSSFGIRAMGVLMAQSYAHYAFSPIWSLPITVYAFLPSLALLQGIPVFPKVYEPLFYLYVFLFLGAYGQDCLDFILTEAILNLTAFFGGFVVILKERNIDNFFMQMFIAGFGVMNSLPFYDAMVLRRDKGRMPTKTTITSTLLVGLLYGIASFVLTI
ncbi:UNVERIFIED_CONTAM: Cellulose synthase-like protein G3 [Sesamum radiatum]|uniref:Cellulose synthase-like protein G3 n=1 Tax=Sesamum radiatum TaxID=300843 RepID=A0AAW2L3A0_SESRA